MATKELTTVTYGGENYTIKDSTAIHTIDSAAVNNILTSSANPYSESNPLATLSDISAISCGDVFGPSSQTSSGIATWSSTAKTLLSTDIKINDTNHLIFDITESGGEPIGAAIGCGETPVLQIYSECDGIQLLVENEENSGHIELAAEILNLGNTDSSSAVAHLTEHVYLYNQSNSIDLAPIATTVDNRKGKFIKANDSTGALEWATNPWTLTNTVGSEAISNGTNSLNLVTRDTSQTISSAKTFSSSLTVGNSTSYTQINNGSILSVAEGATYEFKCTDSASIYGLFINDTDGVYFINGSPISDNYKIYLPSWSLQNKTLATTDQIPSVVNFVNKTGDTMTGDLNITYGVSSLVSGNTYHLHIPAGTDWQTISGSNYITMSSISNVVTNIEYITYSRTAINHIGFVAVYTGDIYGISKSNGYYELGSASSADFDCDFVYSSTYGSDTSFLPYITQTKKVNAVSVSASGTATDTVSYITVNGTEYKLPTGGSGGTSDFNELSNRPQYGGTTMSSSTNIPIITINSSSGVSDGTNIYSYTNPWSLINTTSSESISDGTNTLNLVTKDTTQTISGAKTFSNGITIGSTALSEANLIKLLALLDTMEAE